MQTPSLPSYREVSLSKGQVAIVDADDYERVASLKWHAQWSNFTKSFYAVRQVQIRKGKWNAILMHRFILGLERGDTRLVDHINRNSLDNRRCNLRLCTRTQNAQNSPQQASNTSGYKGVSLKAGKNKWVAQITVKGKKLHLGYFPTPEEAHEAYKKAALKYHGEFANLGHRPPS